MEEYNLKHLEFLQNNIARMSQCSFQIKGLEIAVVAALMAIYAASIGGKTPEGNVYLIIVAMIPTFIFWVLDSYYLAKEKDYRELYNRVAGIKATEKTIDDFCLDTRVLGGDQASIVKTMRTPTEVVLYGSMIIGLSLLSLLIGYMT